MTDNTPSGGSSRPGGTGAATPTSPDEEAKAAEAVREAVSGHPLLRGFAVGVLLTVAMAFFIFQNGSDSDFDWLWMEFTAPLWQALLVAFLAGAVASPLLGLGLRRSLRRRRDQKQAVDRLTKRMARRSRKSKEP